MVKSKEPRRNVYVGHRYVPKIFGEWDKQNQYEGLSIVTHQGNSYTSKKRVPVGIDILNEEYWVVTGNYNAQVEEYRKEVKDLSIYVDTELDKKSDKIYVDTELGKKADKTYVDTELGKKSDKTYVDTELDKKSDKTYVDTELDKKSDQSYVDTELGKKADVITETVDYYIPDDYGTLSQAVSDIYKKHSNGVTVNIIIRSGHRPSLRIYMKDAVLPNVKLQSEDDIVKIGDNLDDSQNLIDLSNIYGFQIDCLIDMEGQGNHGIFAQSGTFIKVNNGCGIINAGGDGIHVRTGSTANAQYTIFTGAGKNIIGNEERAGISAWGGIVRAHGSDVSGSAHHGARAAHGGNLDIDNGIADNCGYHGIRASQNGRVSARYASAQNSGIHGLYALDASIIHGDQVNVSNAGHTGIYSSSGSTIQASSAIANGCDIGARAERSSTLSVQDLTAENCKSRSLKAGFNSHINARNSELNFSGGYGVECAENSTMNIQNSNIISSKLRGIHVSGASTVNANVCAVRDTQPDNTSAVGVFVTGLSRLNLGSAHVRGNGGTDIISEYGSSINVYNTYTTESYGSGERRAHLDDINLPAFNTPNRHGIIFD